MTLAACALVWRVAASVAWAIPSCVCRSLARVAAGPGDGLRREVRSGLEGADEGFIGQVGRDRGRGGGPFSEKTSGEGIASPGGVHHHDVASGYVKPGPIVDSLSLIHISEPTRPY